MLEFVTIADLSDYKNSLKLMEDRVNQIINKNACEVVYLVEYSDVYTSGVRINESELLDNIKVISTGRGGKLTFHGPGQRVIYPILDLSSSNRKKDLKLYIKMLEEWIVNSLLFLGIKAYTIQDKIGIWVTIKNVPAKIAAIGVRVRKWVTYHGIAINISTDLRKFSSIVPCGLKGSLVTSLNELGVNIDMQQFDKVLYSEFNKIF